MGEIIYFLIVFSIIVWLGLRVQAWADFNDRQYIVIGALLLLVLVGQYATNRFYEKELAECRQIVERYCEVVFGDMDEVCVQAR